MGKGSIQSSFNFMYVCFAESGYSASIKGVTNKKSCTL